MLEKTFPQHNLRVVDLVELIRTRADIDLVNELHFYQLLEEPKLTKDVKKLMYHYITSAICDYLLKTECYEKIVFCFNPIQIKSAEYPQFELVKYLSEEKIVKEIESIVQHIAKTLPVKVYFSKWFFDSIVWYIDQRLGEGQEIIYQLKQLAHQMDPYYTFAKAMKYNLTHDLVALQKLIKSPARTRLLLA